jgi:hypothetical protein
VEEEKILGEDFLIDTEERKAGEVVLKVESNDREANKKIEVEDINISCISPKGNSASHITESLDIIKPFIDSRDKPKW